MERDDDRSGRHVLPLFLRNNNQLTTTIVKEATGDGEASAGGKGGRGEGGREHER